MDGKGRCIDNVFVERLWRSLKYEEVYLHAYDDVGKPGQGSGGTSTSTISSAHIRRSATRRPTRSIAGCGRWLESGRLQHPMHTIPTACQSPPGPPSWC
jgi:transposase InsO family protein